VRNVGYSGGLCNNFLTICVRIFNSLEYTCPIFLCFLFFSACFDICRTPLSLLLLLCLQTKILSCIVTKAVEMQMSHCIVSYFVLFLLICATSRYVSNNTDLANMSIRGPTQKKVCASNSFCLTNSGSQLESPSK